MGLRGPFAAGPVDARERRTIAKAVPSHKNPWKQFPSLGCALCPAFRVRTRDFSGKTYF